METVRSPTQFTATLAQRYRYAWILVQQLVITDFKLRYQGSVLGYLWSLLKPLFLFTILYIVFVRFLRFGGDSPYPAISLLLGVVLWSYFVEVTNNSLTTIVSRGELLRKLNFPRYVVVVSVAAGALINLLLNLIVVALFMALSRVPVGPQLLLLPLLIIELSALSVALGFLLSALYVRFRDLSYIWDVGLQAAFYATPIIYPLSFIPIRYAKIIMLSPLAQIIQDARWAVVSTKTKTISTLYGDWWPRLIPLLIVVIAVLVSVYYFRRASRWFAEEV
jgi:ABC-2 type transport system permease protein